MKFIKRMTAILFILSLILAAAAFYALKIEPYRTVVKTYDIGPAAISRTVTLVQVSDIQISPTYTEDHLKELAEKINGLHPDILLFTGDLYDNYAQYGPEEFVIEQLSAIEAPLGKFAVYGNRDYGGGSSRRYEAIMEASGFRVFKNDGAAIPLPGGRSIFIGGMDDYLLGNPDIEPVLSQMASDCSYRILMTHEPDTADFYADSGFDLILAGHSHGGQVHIPFTEGISTAMARKYRSGFYQLPSEKTADGGPGAAAKLYVNQGIGTSHYPVRFLVPPEITVFHLLSEQGAQQAEAMHKLGSLQGK